MEIEEFEAVVKEEIESLPRDFKEKLDNVAVLVEPWPTPQDLQSIKAHPRTLLFGLYRGVPQTQRGAHYSALPDKIVIFAGPILMASKDLEDAKKRIRRTVLHEIGHHFGMSEERIRRAEQRVDKPESLR